MHLTYTTAAFRHHGVVISGVPVLVHDDMTIVEAPQRWLFYIALDRGRTRSPATSGRENTTSVAAHGVEYCLCKPSDLDQRLDLLAFD